MKYSRALLCVVVHPPAAARFGLKERGFPAARWLLAGLLGLAGCGDAPGSDSPQGLASGSAANANAPTANPGQPETESADVKLRMVDLAGIREVLASKVGQIVVMDCWSTWCEPCLREFPNLVQIHAEHGGQGVACVSLNMDYDGLDEPEDLRPAVMSFLTQQDATFDNLMSTAESDVVYRELNFSSVPTVFVFGRDGALVRKLSGARVDYGEVRAILRELLAQGS